ncbi:DEAD/DEAH box helicase [Cyclobacteriaceae bacterium]|nr:DEAD/DEAH box helicase [Cyclobacteriaceae bacterium]
MKLDTSNIQFQKALDLVENQQQSIFLTGKAGTGKTTFLKYFRERNKRKMVVLAPTGIAAINAKGQTIHSFFNLSFGPLLIEDYQYHPDNLLETMKYNKTKIKLIKELEVLVIDEISMVRVDILDMIDRILRVIKKNSILPFGGVQLVLIGDIFQLPPIVSDDLKPILSPYYKSPFFFSANSYLDLNPGYIELDKVYRQADYEFVQLLNKIRVNHMCPSDYQQLNQRVNALRKEGESYITLATHNHQVNHINASELGKLKSNTHIFDAKIDGTFSKNSLPTEDQLELKEGAQIMFIKNDLHDPRRFYNGSIGEIVEISDKGIKVQIGEYDPFYVPKDVWENVTYEWNPKDRKVTKNVLGTFNQYPIRLAWAITVHKSQGLTFDYVEADLGKSFSEGQVYVALSRCRTFEGLVLKSRIHPQAIKTNPHAIRFYKKQLNL